MKGLHFESNSGKNEALNSKGLRQIVFSAANWSFSKNEALNSKGLRLNPLIFIDMLVGKNEALNSKGLRPSARADVTIFEVRTKP